MTPRDEMNRIGITNELIEKKMKKMGTRATFETALISLVKEYRKRQKTKRPTMEKGEFARLVLGERKARNDGTSEKSKNKLPFSDKNWIGKGAKDYQKKQAMEALRKE